MPRRKKKDIELTKDEAVGKLFPKEVVKELKRIAHAKEDKAKKRSSRG